MFELESVVPISRSVRPRSIGPGSVSSDAITADIFEMELVVPISRSIRTRSIGPGSVSSRPADIRSSGPRHIGPGSVSAQPVDLRSVGPRRVSSARDKYAPDICTLIGEVSWPHLAKHLESGEYSESIKMPSNKLEFPLHMAVDRKAPTYIIDALLREYPEAATIMNLEGNYPLHSACQHRLDPSSLYSLISVFPDALNKKNNFGKKPSNFRQYNKTSTEYISKPTCCWDRFIDHQKTNAIRLEKLKALEKQKTHLRNEINELKFRVGVQKDIFKEFQRISTDFPERAAIYKVLNEKMSKLESYSREGMSNLKERMTRVNLAVEGDGFKTNAEYHQHQNKYANEVTERVKLLEQDLKDSQENIDDASRPDEELVRS